jgi:DNA-directed RNA polymerase delta subunit
MSTETTQPAEAKLNIEKIIGDILKTLDKDREKEIISRRFGLYDRKETLEQIGELLSITRERVRQLEKSLIAKLKASAEQKLPHIPEVEAKLTELLDARGGSARVFELSTQLTDKNTKIDQARVAFLAMLCPNLSLLDDNDHYFQAVGISKLHGEKEMRELVGKVLAAIKKIGAPTDISTIAKEINHTSDQAVASLASISRNIATLNNRWGHIKWPMVNPKNIRDKIYVILYEAGKHMHFSQIAASIKGSDFKRKDVTMQAIHNELIKDKRFVLIGRGIYALKEWGYEKGTVSDIIAGILSKANKPMHRDEIVKEVLKSRFVKETTILLNLQGKPQFKRVAKATYALAE